MRITAADIAQRVGGAVEGDGTVIITGMNSLLEAGPGDIGFLANPKYTAQVGTTKASVVLVGMEWKGTATCTLIRVKNPDLAFAQIAEWIVPPVPKPAPGVHPLACVAEGVVIGRDASIGPFCVLEPGVKVGDRTVLFGGCYLARDVTVGDDCLFYPHVTVRERVRIGSRVILHSGTVVGSDGFGYSWTGTAWVKIPQVGIVEVGDDTELGANVTVDRARFGQTVIGKDVKLDNLVQVAHNVRIGDHSAMASQVGLSGSTIIGKGVRVGGQAGFAGHLEVGDGAIVGAKAGVPKDVPANTFVSGYPAIPHEKWLETNAHMMRLPKLKERLGALEKKVEALEALIRKLQGG